MRTKLKLIHYHVKCALQSHDKKLPKWLVNFVCLFESFNSLSARGNFCCLQIIFANSLDPDQAQQSVGPDLEPNRLTLIVFLKVSYETINFEKKSTDDI